MQRLALKSCAIGLFSCVGIQPRALSTDCKSSTIEIPYSSSEQVILTPALPGSKPGNNFMVVYDKRTRNPKYVVERLNQAGLACSDDDDANEKKKKRKPFFSEPSIESESFKVCVPLPNAKSNNVTYTDFCRKLVKHKGLHQRAV